MITLFFSNLIQKTLSIPEQWNWHRWSLLPMSMSVVCASLMSMSMLLIFAASILSCVADFQLFQLLRMVSAMCAVNTHPPKHHTLIDTQYALVIISTQRSGNVKVIVLQKAWGLHLCVCVCVCVHLSACVSEFEFKVNSKLHCLSLQQHERFNCLGMVRSS